MTPTRAESVQIGFELKKAKDHYLYSYLWKDSNNQKFGTRFLIPKRAVEIGTREFSAKREALGSEYEARLNTLSKVKQVTQKIEAQRPVKFSFTEDEKGLAINMSWENDADKKLLQEVSKLWDKLTQEELSKISFFIVEGNLRTIDYYGIGERHQKALKGLADSLRQSAPDKSKRGLTEHTLEFIQTIPYDQKFGTGASFQTPIGMLTENKGDCDTKCTALSTILHYYGVESILILTKGREGHAFLAAKIARKPGEIVINWGGETYVALETTKPNWRTGKLSEETKEKLRRNQYRVISPK